MGILGGRHDDGEDAERGGDTVALNLDDLVCPTCGRELPPWVSACPDDGATPVERAQTGNEHLPDIPAHLLDGLDDQPAPAERDPDPEEGDDTA